MVLLLAVEIDKKDGYYGNREPERTYEDGDWIG